jgi:hypothetical protein
MKVTVEFEEGDLAPLHDIVYELTEIELTDQQLEIIWGKLPEHLRMEAIHWGLNDTVVKDNIYEHLEKERNEYINKKQ